MFKNKFVLLTLVVAGFLFTGCPKDVDDYKSKSVPLPVISFNISGADALGGRNVSSGRFVSGARDADDSNDSNDSNDSFLVTILEDGTLESAISADIPDIETMTEEEIARYTKYGKLIDVFLPPKESKVSDVYLLFDGPTLFLAENAEDPENTFNETWGLSCLIAIHEDGTWTDILVDSPWDAGYDTIDNKRNIQIAPDGSLYVLFREPAGWEYYIRKYDPATKSVTEICRFGRSAPLLEETDGWTEENWNNASISVNRMKISKDGKWAYMEVRQSQAKGYLHVLSLEDPSDCTDILLDYSGKNEVQYLFWDYDPIEDKLYYLQITKDDSEDENITSRIIYKADSNGQKPKIYKEQNVSDICWHLFVVGEDTVWIDYGRSDGGEGYENVFIDVKTGKEVLKIGFTDDITCLDNYIIKDNAIYLCYEGGSYDNDLQCYAKNRIVRIPIEDGTVINYTDKLPEKENIMVKSWSVGDSKLYITGLYEGNPISYGMNVDGTGTPQKVAEGQVFTCLGSLK